MITAILKSNIQNLQFFLVAWIVIIAGNQIFIFGACFHLYCIIAALPHTSVIAALVTYFYHKNDLNGNGSTSINQSDLIGTDVKENILTSVKNESHQQPDLINKILCPNCGSLMQVRVAKRGRYAGRQFLGCSKFPQCNGLVNIE